MPLTQSLNLESLRKGLLNPPSLRGTLISIGQMDKLKLRMLSLTECIWARNAAEPGLRVPPWNDSSFCHLCFLLCSARRFVMSSREAGLSERWRHTLEAGFLVLGKGSMSFEKAHIWSARKTLEGGFMPGSKPIRQEMLTPFNKASLDPFPGSFLHMTYYLSICGPKEPDWCLLSCSSLITIEFCWSF